MCDALKKISALNCRIIVFALVVLLMGSGFINPHLTFADDSLTAVKPDYGILAGEWQRTDGNYLITVDDVQADGRVTVAYFNPKPIHVAQTAISTQEGLIKLFIQFQDKNYEGSTYKLYYYAEKDALAGFYYQAPMDKTYKVVFIRKNK